LECRVVPAVSAVPAFCALQFDQLYLSVTPTALLSDIILMPIVRVEIFAGPRTKLSLPTSQGFLANDAFFHIAHPVLAIRDYELRDNLKSIGRYVYSGPHFRQFN